ncbi:MAG: redoxin domain-containing protein [Deltaproteobacteria bacterium]|nr:redoxin domain-containing protein [Deltaproteobacteria bacterium]
MNGSKNQFIILGGVVICLAIGLGTALWLRLGPYPQLAGMKNSSASDDGLKQYGAVPDFHLTERNGDAVTLAHLRGRIWIADFIYTSCTDTCPLQTAMMARLQEEYAGKPNFQLVSVTVEPERDTPQALSAYAAKHNADAKRWFFLTGQRDRIISLIHDGFHLSVAPLPGSGEESGMIAHSPRFVLIDGNGQIRGYYDSRELTAFVRLKNDVDTLLKG